MKLNEWWYYYGIDTLKTAMPIVAIIIAIIALVLKFI